MKHREAYVSKCWIEPVIKKMKKEGHILEGMELLNFQIISNSGDAKSYLFEALKDAREENFKDAEECIKKAEKSLEKAHEFHSKILTQEAQNESIKISLLLVHAEDQLACTGMLLDITKEMLLMNKKYSGIPKK